MIRAGRGGNRIQMKELLIRLVVGAAVVIVIAIGTAWVISGDLVEPARSVMGRPPLDLEASNITFASSSGALIHGWLSRGKPGQGVVLLLHGTRGDRRDMSSRAQFLHKLGYTVLLFDFQAHGDSRGQQVTFGERESRDVVASLQYIAHELPDEHIGVIGVSLGAASFVLAAGRPAVNAVVLESMYPTIQQAVSERIGWLGPILGPVVFTQVQARLQIPDDRLRVVDRMSKLGAPVLIVNGARDHIDAARQIFAAAAEPKEFWAVEGAGHVDLHAFAKGDYERRIGDFLGRYLPNKAAR
jgi:pimeloyl-ACP methyl ester carboxylesterase